jgi:membrane protein implicated in regulation of membrane protease activity
VLVAAELATGTFYLLMLALGAAGGALAGHAGWTSTGQMAAAAVVGGVAIALWHVRRSRHPAAAPASSNPDVNLDIGATVNVDEWRADGTARVHYRGASWSARHAAPGTPQPGEHVIVSVTGNELGLAPVGPR